MESSCTTLRQANLFMAEMYRCNDRGYVENLPRKLTEDASGPFGNEAPGDLCCFSPWGNLAMFYAGYSYSGGLIRLGRFDFEALLVRGTFPLTIERII